MNFLKIFFITNRPFLEAATQVKPLFMILLLSSFLWAGILYLFYWTNSPREVVIDLVRHENVDETLKAGMVITDFLEFDVPNARFTIGGHLWFLFDPRIYSIADFQSFEFERGKLLRKAEPQIATKGQLTYASFAFAAETRPKIDFVDFPLDKHRIDLAITNILLKSEKSIGEENLSFELTQNAIGYGWQERKLQSRVGTVAQLRDGENTAHKNLSLVFSVVVERISAKMAVIMLMPLFLIFLIGVISLSFDALKNFSAILSLSVGSLTGSLFFRSVIENNMPITDQFTIADRVYLLMMMLNVLILGVQIYILHYFRNLQAQTHLAQLIQIHLNNINILRGCLFVLFLLILEFSTFAIFF